MLILKLSDSSIYILESNNIMKLSINRYINHAVIATKTETIYKTSYWTNRGVLQLVFPKDANIRRTKCGKQLDLCVVIFTAMKHRKKNVFE